MCGIVGYVGPQAALDVVVEGLRRLEYRGYDSAGVAIVAENAIHLAKKAGKISNLEKLLAEDPLPRTGLGLGHTRWATHGAPNDVNAHPHVSAGGRVAVVHNGIIENYVSLRAELHRAGITLSSQTDTEIVAHMLGL
jgi:glutamine---fructose-6-phosphate transaminase (isomerizing)